MISPEAITEFNELWEKHSGEKLPEEIATEIAFAFLSGFSDTYRPVKRDWLKDENEYENAPASQETNL